MTPRTGCRLGLVLTSILAMAASYLPGAGATTHYERGLPGPMAARSCGALAIVSRWNIDRLIAQLIVIPVDQTALLQARPEVAEGIGGIVLTGSPRSDLSEQIATVLKAAPDGIAPLVMTDEEGGAVQRLWPLIGDVPSARTMGETMTPAAIERRAMGLAASMRRLGLTMDLAPVADIDSRPGPNLMNADGTRAFSGNVATASRDALAFASGLERGGIIPVIKHFPGLGGTVGNTDFVGASTPPWSVVKRTGLIPFARAIRAGIPALMVSNAAVPGLSRTPASLSRVVVTGELRARLHFRGLILTDSLSAVAIRDAYASLGADAVAALIAGDDMVLFNAGTSELSTATAGIVLAVRSALARGSISKEQIERAAATVLETKHIGHCPDPIRA